MIRKMISTLLIVGIVYGQDYGSNTGKPKETVGNEEKVSRLDGILSFKKNPIILKKGVEEILINPGEKIKVIAKDGNQVSGTYYNISISKEEIIISGKKIYYKDIKEINRGSGNKSIEYAFIGSTLSSIVGFFLGNLILSGNDFKGVMRAMFGIAGGISGLVVGFSAGSEIAINFEEPILVNNNQWVIVN